MTWLADPNIWASFATLALLEIVLGVDNLVFNALLAGRACRQGNGITRASLVWAWLWERASPGLGQSPGSST